MTASTPLPPAEQAALDLIAAAGERGITISAIAERTGRHVENERKTIKTLTLAGRIEPVGPDKASKWYRLAAPAPAASEPASGAGMVTRTFDQLTFDPNNPRGRPAQDDIDAKAESIADRGLLQNLVIRPAPDLPAGVTEMIVAGETRWRAIGRLIGQGRLPLDYPIRCLVVEDDAAQAAESALVENVIRRDLNPIQEAKAFRRLIDDFGRTSADIVRLANLGKGDLKNGQRVVQLRLQLLDLPKADQDRIERGELTITAALGTLQQPKEKAPAEVTPAMGLVLVEAADRVQQERIALGQPNGFIPCGFWAEDPATEALVTAGFMQFEQWDGVWNFRIKEGGRAWLLEHGQWPGMNGDRMVLRGRAYAAAEVQPSDWTAAIDRDRYVTDWLNDARPQPVQAEAARGPAVDKVDATAEKPLDLTAGEALLQRHAPPPVNTTRRPDGPLSDVGHRILVEAAHKIAAQPVTTRRGLTGARIGEYWTDEAIADLKDRELVELEVEGPGRGWCIVLTNDARGMLAGGGWDPDAITDKDLVAAAHRAGLPVEQCDSLRAEGRYATRWLNDAAPAAQRRLVADPADEDAGPALFPPSPEEAEQIRAAMTAREMAAQDDAAAEALANAIRRQLADWREAGGGHRGPHPESLDRLLWQAIHLGGPVQAAAAIAVMLQAAAGPFAGQRFTAAATAEHAPEVPCAPAPTEQEEAA